MELPCSDAGRKYYEFLWIDAICIDQGNINERSAQVARMGEIFREATKNRAWLGLASAGDAIELHNISKMYRSGALEYNQTEAYWSRIWIVQECVLARVLVLQCGEHTINPYALSKYASLVGHLAEPMGWVFYSLMYTPTP